MTVFSYPWWIATLVLACGASPLELASAPATTNQGIPCLEYRAEARYSGVGYDHLVHLSNQCEKAVSCAVSTNVNPERISVEVAAKAQQTILTWRGSPAREFKATVTCQLRE